MTAVHVASKDPPLIEDELWLKKFKLWKTMQKGCVAAMGPNGIYCSWEGRNCGYRHCPRRIFEEVSIDPDRIQPKPPQKLKVQIQNLRKENAEQMKVIEDLTKRLELLEAS